MASAPPESSRSGPSTGQFIQAGGNLVRGIGGFQAGKANARMARAEANAALRGGLAQSDDIRREARRVAGEAVAAMGASGGGLGSGSALDVLRDIEVESGLDRLRVQTDARNRSESLNAQARLYRRQGAWNLLGSVVDSASSFAGGGS